MYTDPKTGFVYAESACDRERVRLDMFVRVKKPHRSQVQVTIRLTVGCTTDVVRDNPSAAWPSLALLPQADRKGLLVGQATLRTKLMTYCDGPANGLGFVWCTPDLVSDALDAGEDHTFDPMTRWRRKAAKARRRAKTHTADNRADLA